MEVFSLVEVECVSLLSSPRARGRVMKERQMPQSGPRLYCALHPMIDDARALAFAPQSNQYSDTVCVASLPAISRSPRHLTTTPPHSLSNNEIYPTYYCWVGLFTWDLKIARTSSHEHHASSSPMGTTNTPPFFRPTQRLRFCYVQRLDGR